MESRRTSWADQEEHKYSANGGKVKLKQIPEQHGGREQLFNVFQGSRWYAAEEAGIQDRKIPLPHFTPPANNKTHPRG